MTANKYANVRAGLCWSKEIVSLIRQHNNANILCIPARFTAIHQAVDTNEGVICDMRSKGFDEQGDCVSTFNISWTFKRKS